MRDLREKDWFWLDNGIVDRSDLSIYEKMLYICLARHSNNNTGYSFPSNKTLCKELGIKDERTVQKYTKVLEEKGLVSIEKKRGTSNRYYLKNCILDTSDVPTSDNTTYIGCNEVPTSDVESTHIPCGSNKTITRLNKIMNHEEHDFFENIFKIININFTTKNQKSVINLLKKQSKESVKEYLLEAYENLKNNPDIKNLSGAFTSKILTGDRQPLPPTKRETIIKESQTTKINNTRVNKAINHIENNRSLQIDLEKEKSETEKLDLFFSSLSSPEQESIMEKAINLAKLENNAPEKVIQITAKRTYKYKVLRGLLQNQREVNCGKSNNN